MVKPMIGIAEFQCWKINKLFPAAFTIGTTGFKAGKITFLCSWEANSYLLSTEGNTDSRVVMEQLLLLNKCLVNGVVPFGRSIDLQLPGTGFSKAVTCNKLAAFFAIAIPNTAMFFSFFSD